MHFIYNLLVSVQCGFSSLQLRDMTEQWSVSDKIWQHRDKLIKEIKKQVTEKKTVTCWSISLTACRTQKQETQIQRRSTLRWSPGSECWEQHQYFIRFQQINESFAEMDLFCQSSHSWQAVFLQQPGFLALSFPIFLRAPALPTAWEVRLWERGYFHIKQPCRLFPGHQRLQCQGSSKRQADGLSRGLPQLCPVVVPLCTLNRFTSLWKEFWRGEKKNTSPFCQKNPAFCVCTLVLNSIQSFHLALVTGPGFCSTHQANRLFPLCAVIPMCKACKMHHRETTNLRTGIHSSGKTNELLLILFTDPLST